MTILLRQKPLPQVVRQIVQRDNGAWFDPEDMSTMYQDSTGTTPVTALEQPVGLWLDKSQGLEFGPELVTNGDFSSGTAGWYTSPASPPPTLATVSGELYVTNNAAGSAAGAASNIATNTGKFYTVTANIRNVSAVDVRVRVINGTILGDVIAESQIVTSSLASKITITFKARETTSVIYLRSNNFGVGVFDNISVREIKGNHATQSITASRPTLSARYNSAIDSKTVMTGFNSWVGSAVGTVNSALAPDGTLTASTVTAQEWMWREGFGGTFGPVNFSVYAKAPAGAAFTTNINIWNAGSSTLIASKSITVTDTWKRFDVSGTTTAGASLCRVGISNVGGGQNPVVGSMWWGYQVTNGLSLFPYQRVNTATDYDSVGFPKYIKAEGVDDHFVLPYLGLYNNASCSIIASHSSSSQAANGVIVSEASSTDADTKYLPYRQLASAGNVDSYIAADNAAVILDSTGAAYSGTKENIIESIIDSGTSIETYRSGVLLSNEPYTRSATLTLNNTTLFGSVSTTNTNFLNTKLYGLIITKSNLSARDRSLCETYLKSKVQVLQV